MEKITSLQSLDLVAEHIEQLKQIFPEVVKEGKVDFDALQDALGNYTDTLEERFQLNWVGKAKARREAQKRCNGTLRPCPGESEDWDNTQNLYIEGDNLEVLKLLQKSYHNKVKMIYIDPPYNTGKDFVYKDNYHDNLANYLEQSQQDKSLSTNTESDGRYHSNWLNMMYPRLKLARNLLREDGVIFISIGVEEFATLKKMCDEIFGEDNFVEIFSWVKTATPPALSTKSRKTNEYILCYEKQKNNYQYQGELLGHGSQPLLNSGNAVKELIFSKESVMFNPEKFVNGTYSPTTSDRVELLDEIEIVDGYAKSAFRLAGEFKWTQEFLNQEIEKGTTFVIKTKDLSIRFIRTGEGYKRPTNFIKEQYTSPVIDKPSNKVETNEGASSHLINLMGSPVFSYPKPVSLLKYLINFVISENDIVLDFFSGSASTAEAIMSMNIDDEALKLKYIMVQLPENLEQNLKTADSITKPIIENGINLLKSSNKPLLLTELAKERIRRAAKKILKEREEMAKKDGFFAGELPKLDTGFKVFKLDTSNISTWDGNPENLQLDLENSVQNIKVGRSEHDLLYEILIKYGFELSTNVEEHDIEGKKVYAINNAQLMICLADNITSNTAEGIAKLWKQLNPEQDEECKVVFKDNGFASDSDKANCVLLLKQYGIVNVASV